MSEEIEIAGYEDQLRAAASPIERINALNELAWRYYQREPERSRQTLVSAHDLLKSHPDYKKGAMDACTVEALLHTYAGETEQALTCAEQAIAYYRNLPADPWLCRALSLQSQLYNTLGDYARALEVNWERRSAAFALGSMGEVGITLNAIARIVADNGDYAEALEYYGEALMHMEAEGDLYPMAMIRNNMARPLRALGRYTEAITASQEALELFKQADITTESAFAYGQLGQTYLEMGDLENAEKHFLRQGELFAASERILNQAKSTIDLATVYNKMGQPERAIACINSILELVEARSANRHLYMCHQVLATAYRTLGDFERAFHHYEQFHLLTEQVFTAESDERIKRMQVLNRTQQMALEIENERNLRQQQQQYYERLSGIKDEIISHASHDLKSPLTAILTTAYLLQKTISDAPDTARQTILIDHLEQHALNMRDLISSLLDIACLETGQGLHCEPVRLADLIQSTVQSFEDEFHVKNLETHMQIQDVPEVSVDSSQIKRVMANLISNAIKFTPSGGQITTTLTTSNHCVSVSVQDNGIGIPETDLDHIFDQFYRAENTDDAQIEGTGLGLSIVKTIVERHHGTIHAESSVGKGTLVRFTLPLNGTCK